MKNPKSPPLPPGLPPLLDDVDDLARLAGLDLPGSRKSSASDQVASKFARKATPEAQPDTSVSHDRDWLIQKRFADLHQKCGRPFFLFLTDLLDIVLSVPSQEKLVKEIGVKKRKGKKEPVADPMIATGSGKVPVVEPKELSVTIGGEPFFIPQNFLKRKGFLASLFLESEEYPSFLKLIKQMREVCAAETTLAPEVLAGPAISQALTETTDSLRQEITREQLINLWTILEKMDYTPLESVFQQIREIGLVRPTFYEDLDKAYREGKRILKLLIAELSGDSPNLRDKKDHLLDYLENVLEVYTYHHFILKSNQKSRIGISRKEFEKREKEAQTRIEALRKDAQEIRDLCQKVQTERDLAVGESRARDKEVQELREKFRKYDPAEVDRQLRAMEAKVNAAAKERQAILEEDAELRTALRNLDTENQQLTQKLRDLHALPDENAKSVDSLLVGKKVVVFGGVGRDHYLPLLKEAGVKEADYEWYEGYHTISQARTADICGRADVIAVVTAYAGHLILWQVRDCVKPHQTLFLIHKSGAGSLRQHIIDAFRKPQGK